MDNRHDTDGAERDPGRPDGAVPRSVGRVLDLLEIVLRSPCNLTGAASEANLTPTTALRHLRALESRGYVRRNPDGEFAAGPTMRRLAAALHAEGDLARLIDVAQPHLDDLAVATGESTYLAVGDGHLATYVATAASGRAIRHVGWVGQTVPLDGTAVGDALRRPGACRTRTGAVEPDITAVSIGLPSVAAIDAALSVIGPSARLDRRGQRVARSALTQASDAIADAWGT